MNITVMEVENFMKSKTTQKFLNVESEVPTIQTKKQVLSQIEKEIAKCMMDSEPKEEIKKSIEVMVSEYEPYTEEIQQQVKELLNQWGLK